MRKILLNCLGYGCLYVMVFFILGEVQGDLVIFTPLTKMIFSAIIVINLYALIRYFISKQRQDLKLLLIAYLALVLGILFLRNPALEFQYTLKWYLPTWFKYLFSNRIVFVNVIGNILLFVPLGLIIRILDHSYWRYLLCLVMILLLEVIQLVTKLGVLDLTDVILNYSGILIGFALYYMRKGTSYERVSKRSN